MKNHYLTITTGLALFSMFFGSGNLVYPIEVGVASGGHSVLASFGFFLTAVLVPFLGAFGMLLFKGNTNSFFGCFGKLATFWFPLIALALMGPFGVLARCITVAHGSFTLLFPDVALVPFSIGMCVLIFLLTVKKNQIVPYLGKIMTPFLLLSLFVIAVAGIYYGNWSVPKSTSGWATFKESVFQGYQTMDLLAAFFFSTFIIQHLDQEMASRKTTQSPRQVFLKAAVIGGGLLTLVYISLVLLGEMYAPQLAGVPQVEMLGVIAREAIGPMSAPIVCVAVVLACLTTAVVLASLFAEFFYKEVMQEKISLPQSMIVTLGIAFAVSTFEFGGIASFLGPILATVYPALIVLTVFNISSKLWGHRVVRWPIVLTLGVKLFYF